MKSATIIAAVLGLLLFCSEASAAKKSSCANGQCSVEKSAPAPTTEKAVTTETTRHTKRERVRSGRGLHLWLPLVGKLFCRGCG